MRTNRCAVIFMRFVGARRGYRFLLRLMLLKCSRGRFPGPFFWEENRAKWWRPRLEALQLKLIKNLNWLTHLKAVIGR